MTDSDVTFTSGLYWRRSAINARRCVPVILTLAAGRLRMRTATEQAFDAPLGEVSAAFSRLTTMFLTVAGTKYPIVGIGGSISPKFTPEMLAELETAHATAAGRYRVSGSAGGAGGALGGAAGDAAGAGLGLVGLASSVSDFGAMRKNITPWRDVFTTLGVSVTT